MRSVALALALVALPGSASSAATIGLYADPTCAQTHMSLPLGSVGTFYVAYRGPEPMQGVEFRIDGMPASWAVLSVTPTPTACFVLGSPLGAGTNIAFCTVQETDCVNLFTIVVGQTPPAMGATLTVTHRDPPSNPEFNCPFAVFYCGAPCDWWGCCEGGQLFVDTTVAVDAKPWSQVKELYR
jgi:hypothetical protein